MEIHRYCCGFLFSPDNEYVVLVKKKRPLWQKGYLNGVGGRIEEGETPRIAMTREFKEETGITHYNWTQYCVLTGYDYIVHFFKGSSKYYSDVKSITDEEIKVVKSSYILMLNVINNLKWLIPMALDSANVESLTVEHRQ